MSTRHAKPGSPLRQDRFSSSRELETGLLANLVARRCSILKSAQERELIWFLQLLSHREGGIEKVAADLVERFRDRVGTAAMLSYGMKPGQIYKREQVESICRDLDLPWRADFPLRGEMEIELSDLTDQGEWDYQRRREEAQQNPECYPAEKFRKVCQEELSKLAEDLKVFCLNPTRDLNSAAPWYFAALPVCLREYHDGWVAARRDSTVTTELGEKVCDALDYALEEKCMVLIEGCARTGKTFSAKAWCEQRPGRARYVQIPSTNDEIGFYRAIAKALGVSSGLSWKAFELRERIEAVLQSGDLILVCDEAHFCWPVTGYRYALPNRVTWIMTALVNFNVPVGLVTTPQFIETQKLVEARTHWTSQQFIGRIGHYEKLPAVIDMSDLKKVALALLPDGDETSIEILVNYANTSAKYLAGIEAVVRRAHFLGKREGRNKASRADIKRAIKESVIPSDNALAQALAVPMKASGKRSSRPLQTPLQSNAGELQSNRRADTQSDFVGETPTELNRLGRLRADRDLASG